MGDSLGSFTSFIGVPYAIKTKFNGCHVGSGDRGLWWLVYPLTGM